jgi:uncharacterized damage-inducible protein DinB
MNEFLREAFRHGAWATKALIAACRGLSVEQLQRRVRGFGSILATLNHVVLSEAGYAAILTAVRPAWVFDGNDSDDLDQIAACVDETTGRWVRGVGRGDRGGCCNRAASAVMWPIWEGQVHALLGREPRRQRAK